MCLRIDVLLPARVIVLSPRLLPWPAPLVVGLLKKVGHVPYLQDSKIVAEIHVYSLLLLVYGTIVLRIEKYILLLMRWSHLVEFYLHSCPARLPCQFTRNNFLILG